MKKGFLGLGEGGDNHRKKTGGKFSVVSNTTAGSNTPSGTIDATTAPVNVGAPNEVDTGSIPFINVFNVLLLSPTKYGSEKLGQDYVIKEIPSSYGNKRSLTSKVKLRKLNANVSNDADYDVWLHLESVHEVNDRMKNSLYGYFLGKRLVFLVVE
ncbi:hypothetical protein Tco_0323387 [Tanacetum coccineum]